MCAANIAVEHEVRVLSKSIASSVAAVYESYRCGVGSIDMSESSTAFEYIHICTLVVAK